MYWSQNKEIQSKVDYWTAEKVFLGTKKTLDLKYYIKSLEILESLA